MVQSLFWLWYNLCCDCGAIFAWIVVQSSLWKWCNLYVDHDAILVLIKLPIFSCAAKRQKKSISITYLVVLQFTSNNSEGIVNEMVIDMNFGQPVGGARRHPFLVQVVVDHDRCPGRGNALLWSFIPEKEQKRKISHFIWFFSILLAFSF